MTVADKNKLARVHKIFELKTNEAIANYRPGSHTKTVAIALKIMNIWREYKSERRAIYFQSKTEA